MMMEFRRLYAQSRELSLLTNLDVVGGSGWPDFLVVSQQTRDEMQTSKMMYVLGWDCELIRLSQQKEVQFKFAACDA
jgi:hypothetical protein